MIHVREVAESPERWMLDVFVLFILQALVYGSWIMASTLYLDCFSGISGDMTIAALLDLGASRARLELELRKLGLSKEYRLRFSRGKRQQVTGLKFDVITPHDHHHDHHNNHHHDDHGHHHHVHGRPFKDIKGLIEQSRLSSFVRRHALSIFQRIAEVEGKIHGVPTTKVHFHEVGAIDSIVDITGVCILIEDLAPQQILASIPCEGHGFVECAHGRFPVPTTATLELLKGIPLRQIEVEGELITPTGAAILAEFAERFIPIPGMIVTKIGYGLGSKSFPGHPNVLRALWGEAARTTQPQAEGAVDVLETNVDDSTPEILATAMERLFEEGARDVYFTPIVMKKGRPATMITILAEPSNTDRLASTLLRETGSFGLRIRRNDRVCLSREIRKIKTRHGIVEVKVGFRDGRIITAKPEFESCRKLAQKLKQPVRLIWSTAVAEAMKLCN